MDEALGVSVGDRDHLGRALGGERVGGAELPGGERRRGARAGVNPRTD